MTEKLRTVRILWFAFMLQPVVLGVMLVFAAREANDVTAIGPALGMVALSELAFLAFWRWKHFGSTLGITAPDLLRVQDRASDAELKAAVSRVAPQFQTAVIVGLALAMSIAIFGFVLAFMSANLLHYAPFAVGGWLALAVQFPTTTAMGCMLNAQEAKTFFETR